MKIAFETFEDNDRYESLLTINAADQWKETLYFTFYTPFGEEGEKLFAGRQKADVHFRSKPYSCVKVFDFHKWTADTIKEALENERIAMADKALVPEIAEPLADLLEKSLEERDTKPEGFELKLKYKIKKK